MLRRVPVSLRSLVGFRGGGGRTRRCADLSSYAPSLSEAPAAASGGGWGWGWGRPVSFVGLRWFSGIRNIPRDEALKYMPRLKKTRSAREAINILKDIERDGFIPSVFNYNLTISKCAKDGKLEEAKKIFRQMQHNKVSPSEVTFNSLIDACANAGKDSEALQFLRDMEEMYGLLPNVRSYNSTKIGRAHV